MHRKKFTMRLSAVVFLLLICGAVEAQLTEVVTLDFDDATDVTDNPWMFVAPTPLGVTQADPGTTLSTSDGDWIWSIGQPNEVLVGIYADPGHPLTDASVATTLSFEAASAGGYSIGFLNRFGSVENPDPTGNPLAHGYCTLVSSETVTLIDFDFARDPSDYIRAIAQTDTPEGLFSGESTEVLFQTMDRPSAGDPSVLLPTFDFWLGGTQIFDGVQDPHASWSSGFSGMDVWSVDPFAQATTESFTVRVDTLTIRGVPEPGGLSLASLAGGVIVFIGTRRARR